MHMMQTLLARHRWIALTSLVLLGGGIGSLFVAQKPSATPGQAKLAAEAEPDPLVEQRTKGKADAPITLYEMSDFQCPYCRRQALETFPLIEKEYIETGKIRWVFLNFPLVAIHPNAVPAAELAMCAAKVNKFWQVHELLFTYQSKWAKLKDPGAFMLSLADSAGIARDAIAPCLENGEMRSIVQGEAEGAVKNGISSTPTVYIENVGIVPGAQPIELYRQVLDSLWKVKSGENGG